MNLRHFNWIVVALGLACAALPTLAVAAEISDPELSAQMDVLQLQRETVNVEHNQMDGACYRRFLVNACRADVARSRRTALGAIAKQELAISQRQRALMEQEAVRADQLRREIAAQQELERQARLADRGQREQDRTQRSAERESEELERRERVAERAQRDEDRAQRLQDRAELEQEAQERAAAQAETES